MRGCGDAGIRRRGDAETRRRGDAGIRGYGDTGIRRRGDTERVDASNNFSTASCLLDRSSLSTKDTIHEITQISTKGIEDFFASLRLGDLAV